LLIEWGADETLKGYSNGKKKTALQMAEESNNSKLVTFLKKAIVDRSNEPKEIPSVHQLEIPSAPPLDGSNKPNEILPAHPIEIPSAPPLGPLSAISDSAVAIATPIIELSTSQVEPLAMKLETPKSSSTTTSITRITEHTPSSSSSLHGSSTVEQPTGTARRSKRQMVWDAVVSAASMISGKPKSK